MLTMPSVELREEEFAGPAYSWPMPYQLVLLHGGGGGGGGT